jgi:type IV pilus assembly protein PilW
MRRKERGFSLLELLIALALALFLSNAVINIFIHCEKTYYLTQGLDEIQTHARIAFQRLSYDIRMAGLIGCVHLHYFLPLNTQLRPETSLVVWHEGYTTAAFNLPALARVRSDSDIILIQALDPNTIPVKFAQENVIVLLRRSPFRLHDKVLISDCEHAEAFAWGYAHLHYVYQKDSEVGFLHKIIYYIGNTGRRTRTGKPIYALYRRNLNKSLSNPIELVAGIEKMHIRLGVRNAKNASLDYISADRIKNWQDVRNVEVSLVFDIKHLRREWKQIIALRERNL